MTQVYVQKPRSWKKSILVKELSEVASLSEPKLRRGSSSLKQALLVQFRIWEFTRNLHFPMIYIIYVILSLKTSTALLTTA
jgi:hypothetical protein